MARGDAEDRGPIARDALVARILAMTAPIVVIEAPAGCGKSWLMEEIAAATGRPLHRGEGPPPPAPLALWDVPGVPLSGALPSDPPGGTRLILTKRPETGVPGLARAGVYGRTDRIGAEDLLFGPDDPGAAWSRTGGWPCLIPAAGQGEAAIVAFLREEVLAPHPGPRLAALEGLLSDPHGPPPPAELLTGLPFVDPDRPRPLHPVLAAVRPALLAALRAILSDRSADPQEARMIGAAKAAMGRLPEAIATLQSVGAWQAAISVLRKARGPFYIHAFGPRALDQALAGFPAELRQGDETLTLCRAIQAVKRGEVALTRRILSDRWGEVARDTRAMLADRERFSVEVRFFRLLFSTWEDFDLDRQYLDLAYDLLAELPPEDDLLRGSLYNAVLEVYIRARRFAEAEHACVRAADHYVRAGVPILVFYIDLHRGIVALFLGDPGAARTHARAAARNLAAARYNSPGDARLLSLLEACIAYEQGEAEPLARFLSLDLDRLAQGEIWPSLVELILVYGSQALAEHYSTVAARGFLDRWRATQERSSQFRMLIDIREVIVLQNGNRWQEAAARAADLPGRVTLAFVQGAGPALAALRDRDEVAMALLWLRQMAWETPARPGLDKQIQAILDNPHLTARQRVGAELWLAHVLSRSRRGPEARAQVQCTLAAVARAGSLALLSEERGFVAELTATQRQRAALETNEPVCRLLRKLQDVGPGRARRGRAHGLTRQEMRILHALAEGAPNKAIAKIMGLSEATVKFHLRNLYRKLDCASRREAVAAATALRLVS